MSVRKSKGYDCHLRLRVNETMVLRTEGERLIRAKATPNHVLLVLKYKLNYEYSLKKRTVHKYQIIKSNITRWSEVTKRLRLDVRIMELTDNGNYEPVQVENRSNNPSCGCFMLKQV